MTSTRTVAECVLGDSMPPEPVAELLLDIADYLRAFHDPEARKLERRARMCAKSLRRDEERR